MTNQSIPNGDSNQPRKLTRKQQLFIEAYLIYWDAYKAAVEAGYSLKTAKAKSFLFIRDPIIQNAIAARLSELKMTADQVIDRLSQQAKANIADFLEVREYKDVKTGATKQTILINWDELTRRGHLVKKIKADHSGVALEMYDAQTALVAMGKVFHIEQVGEVESVTNFSLPADCLSPSFFAAYRDIRDRTHTEYLFFGGRGSTKSSFISLASIWLIVNNPTMHMLATRQVGNTLRDSVYSQLRWAISELGLDDKFRCTTNPLEIVYIPTGQTIYFRGGDDPIKIKSIKPPFGYIGILWFEELDQFRGPEQVRSIEQSAIRGGDQAYIFKSFNPPRTINNWANKYAKIPKATQYQHHSTYLDVPPEWLGKTFLEEAAHLKEVNPAAYEHEYLGVANGTGGQVFENVTIRKITDAEISQFDHVLHGQDWGYYPDPAHYSRCHYDSARRKLYIFGELRAWKLNNRQLYDAIGKVGYNSEYLLIADSAEPKSVADFAEYGATVRGAEKGPDSVDYSIKWLQGLSEIVIDNERCPYTADEFLSYEYERTKDDEIISSYPDANNHAIDSVRYATNLIWRRRGK